MAHDGASEQHEHQYHAKDTIAESMKSTLILGGVGLFVSSIQNSLTRRNVGMLAVFTRTGGTAAAFAAMGASYSFVKNASANLREKDDTWNTTYGGLAAGALLGATTRSTPAIFGYSAALATVLTAFTFTGGKISGFGEISEDEVARKEALRKNRRKPIAEVVNELGEGREQHDVSPRTALHACFAVGRDDRLGEDETIAELPSLRIYNAIHIVITVSIDRCSQTSRRSRISRLHKPTKPSGRSTAIGEANISRRFYELVTARGKIITSLVRSKPQKCNLQQ
ncbi:hypothetical protein MRB53_038584 [Persea americana]|nr:hypothetical protein MRB53_038584 [Persea americana]